MFKFFTILPTQIGVMAMLAVCLAALVVGRRLERLLAVATIVAWFASAAVQTHDRAAVQWGIFTVDLLYLLVLMVCSAFERRLWILFMTAFQLLVVLTHVVFIIDLTLMQWGFFSTYYLWSYAELLAFAVGVTQVGWSRWGPRKARG